MGFKVGDKVKFVKSTIFHTDNVKIGETYKIIKIAGHDVRYQVENKEWFKEEELERVDYTYEDLKKSPIGSKITFEDGKVLIKTEENRFENRINVTYIGEINNHFKDKILGKIIKIEKPSYTTVYEAKKEILDEAEKRYLKGVVRPYKNVKSILKYIYPGNRLESIMITVLDLENEDWLFTLPPFETGKMYKNMEDNKAYTTEELGL